MVCGNLMPRAGVPCGRPAGHRGSCLSAATVARERERMRRLREVPGPGQLKCQRRDCSRQRYRYSVGTLDVRCVMHRDLNRSQQAVRQAGLRRVQLWTAVDYPVDM